MSVAASEGPARVSLRPALVKGWKRNLPWMLPVGTALATLLLWEIVVRVFSVPQVILPPPSAIGAEFVRIMPLLLQHASQTGMESLVALLLAATLGAVIAGVMASIPLARDVLQPNLVALQLIPKIALAPMFIIWLGIDSSSRLAFAVFLSFFPIVIAASAGLAQADETAIRLCRSLTASPLQTFFRVRVPFALPHFFNGLRIASTMAVIGVIVAEFISSRVGLGHYILYASSRMETTGIFAALLMLCIVGLGLFGGVVLIERLVRDRYLR